MSINIASCGVISSPGPGSVLTIIGFAGTSTGACVSVETTELSCVGSTAGVVPRVTGSSHPQLC